MIGINLGVGFGIGKTVTTSQVFRLSNGIQNVKRWLNN